MSRVLLSLVAAGWCLFAVVCFFGPSAIVRGFGIELARPDGVTEIRAMYGGAQLGLAAFFAYASRDQALHRAGLILIILIMGGFAIARAAGMVIDGSTGPLTIGSVVFEVALASVAGLALVRNGARATTAA